MTTKELIAELRVYAADGKPMVCRTAADRLESIVGAWEKMDVLIAEHHICDYDGETDEFDTVALAIRTAILGDAS